MQEEINALKNELHKVKERLSAVEYKADHPHATISERIMALRNMDKQERTTEQKMIDRMTIAMQVSTVILLLSLSALVISKIFTLI